MTVPPSARYPQTYDPAVPVHVLAEHPDNPRLGDTDAIGASMAAHGFYGAVYAQKGTGRIVVGNHRYRVAVARGEETLPVVWLDVDDENAGRILLVDNTAGMAGGFDEERLAAMLGEYHSETELGLVGTGYTIEDLHELLGDTEPEPGYTDPDAIPATPDEPVSRRGDLWVLGPHRLLCGDATDAGDVQRLMAGERATLMATDPPYLVDYDAQNHPPSAANKGKENRNKTWTAYREHEIEDDLYRTYLEVAVAHAITPDAPIYQWHAGTRADLVLAAWEANGVLAHQQIIWAKSRPVLTRSDFMWSHEPCFFGWQRGNRPDKTRRAPVEQPTVWDLDQRGNVDNIHPTQKPVALFEWPISWHTRENEVVYEPFGGSGTALIAAHRTRRVAHVLELAPEFVDVICERFQKHTGVVPVLEATGEPHDFVGEEAAA